MAAEIALRRASLDLFETEPRAASDMLTAIARALKYVADSFKGTQALADALTSNQAASSQQKL